LIFGKPIVDLTGYRKKSKQIAWLRENGFQFIVNAAGYPVVLQGSPEDVKQRLTAPRLGKVR
jgi:hypothetical protein